MLSAAGCPPPTWIDCEICFSQLTLRLQPILSSKYGGIWLPLGASHLGKIYPEASIRLQKVHCAACDLINALKLKSCLSCFFSSFLGRKDDGSCTLFGCQSKVVFDIAFLIVSRNGKGANSVCNISPYSCCC